MMTRHSEWASPRSGEAEIFTYAGVLLMFLSCSLALEAQPNAQPADLHSAITNFPFQDTVPLKIVRPALPSLPFSVVGPRGAALGRQDGSFEAWIFPWKIFSHFHMVVEMKDYPVPIDVNEHAALIDVRPDHTTITFAHANFTIREVLFAPKQAPDGGGLLGFFQIEAVRPMTLTVEFTPEMKRMWPALSEPYSSADWVNTPQGGFYVLPQEFPDHAAAVAMPGAEPGILPPYEERAKSYPAQFVLHFDPARDRNTLVPLLITVADTAAEAKDLALEKKLASLEAALQSSFESDAEYYRQFLDNHLTVETPDKEFDQAFKWAEVAIDQLKVQTIPGHDETALVAGVDESADSARPGFGWFFGRDALWTLYAVDSYGDFALTREQIEFLLRRQSPEGKIMHEWSQAAPLVDWKALPFEYAAADATPLLLMAANDYLQTSGDHAFLESHWEGLKKAWDFECSHDSDNDGIYENIAGTGWVESWFPTMPHQEIYLASLDQQASSAFAKIAAATGHNEIAQSAQSRADHIAKQIESEYFVPKDSFYAFSRNANGTVDTSATIYPAVAAWDGTFDLSRAANMMSRWASAEFSTDWGTRDVSPKVSFYDPISYHQGSVWPLYTGWVSLFEYRNGRTLSGYEHLMQNADLTWAQNLGSVTELLSGEFYCWIGRSTSHQLWSSAMVLSPAIRGMFGLQWNAAGNTVTVDPRLPASWDEAHLTNVPIGSEHVNLDMRRMGAYLEVHRTSGSKVKLASHVAGSQANGDELRIPLPAVEVGIIHGLPEAGSVTAQMKVIDQEQSAHALQLRLAAPADSTQTLFLRVNDRRARVRIEGAERSGDSTQLSVHFPSGTGYVEKPVTISW